MLGPATLSHGKYVYNSARYLFRVEPASNNKLLRSITVTTPANDHEGAIASVYIRYLMLP